MSYANYFDVEQAMKGRPRKKVGHNTYLERREGYVALRFHETDILEFYPPSAIRGKARELGFIRYNTGGWQTVTTKDRLNSFGPLRLFSERRVWYARVPFPSGYSVLGPSELNAWDRGKGKPFPYFEGLECSYDGRTILNPQSTEEAKNDLADRRKMERRIKAYAKLCETETVEPSLGDCFYCLQTTEGKALGDAVGDTEHLTMHMEEGYVVGSLILNALREKGYRDPRFVFGMEGITSRAVAGYLRKRLIDGRVGA